MIYESNKIVNALWIGEYLSVKEILTITSFINHGHTFVLWAYNNIKTPIPENCIVRNANDVIPKSKVFCYKYSNQFGHGKGSFAGFSDIFRYKLLYEYGGWWTDMDVTCLKPLNFEQEFVFRTHHSLPLVGNIIKCPPKSELMLNCYNKAKAEVTEYNRDWHLPIQILVDNVNLLKLDNNIKEFSNPDSWRLIRKLIIKDFIPPDNWFVIHWVNEEWRRNNVKADYVVERSFLGKQLTKNQIKYHKAKFISRIKLYWKLSLFAYLLKK